MSKPNSSVERLKLLLSAGADVHFLVGQGDEEKERLPANKAILSLASKVFEAMFRFDATTQEAPPAEEIYSVEVTDVTIGAFKAMLRFIYTDDLSGLNGDNLFDVLYAAKKYDIPGLVKACCGISEFTNVFDALVQARLLDEHALANCCLDYIDKNADMLVQSEYFLDIEQQLLCEIMGRDQLEISREIFIWNAALRWADAQCRQNGIECSGENRRKMLGPALHEIRFPLISRKDFTTCIVPSGVLTTDEVISVYQHYCHPKLSGVPGLFPLQFLAQGRVSDRPGGTLMLDIEGFSEFAQEQEGSHRLSDTIYIKRHPWKILARIMLDDSTQKCLGFFLITATPIEGKGSCTFLATFRIVSQKGGTRGMARALKSHHTFTSDLRSWGFPEFIRVTELMDPSKGLYNKDEDKVVLAIDVQAEEP